NAGRFITDDSFFVLNADTFYQMDYDRLTAVKEAEDLDIALVLREVEDVSRYGEALLSESRLVGFNEKSTESRPGTINGGIYLMKKALLSDIWAGKVSLENEMIPKWMQEGKRLGGLVSDGYFIDIGVPNDYFKFQEDVQKGVIRW
ncbi:MAG: sugar phosphate nucleotidyltransferase, partial [Clostridium sp.]